MIALKSLKFILQKDWLKFGKKIKTNEKQLSKRKFRLFVELNIWQGMFEQLDAQSLWSLQNVFQVRSSNQTNAVDRSSISTILPYHHFCSLKRPPNSN